MAKEITVFENLKSWGLEPIENNAIVVQFADTNLSAKVITSLTTGHPVYVLQLCKNELVLASLKWNGKVQDNKLQQNSLLFN